MYELDPIETRILGCLLEKQRTTPDAYPLTLNSLRLACNQSTNRDPVMELDDNVVHEALQRLHRRELTRVASGHGSRASKYRHLLVESLGLPEDQMALLCVLLLRGDQTPGELKQRTERLHEFEDLNAVEDALAEMAERELVLRLERRPGEKQVRFRQLLSARDEVSTPGGLEPRGGSEPPDGSEPPGGMKSPDGLEPPEGEVAAAIQSSPAMAGLAAQAGNGLVLEIEQLREALDRLSGEVAELRARLDRREADSGESAGEKPSF